MTKNLVQRVNHALKVATGRQLSKKDLERAREGYEYEPILPEKEPLLSRSKTAWKIHQDGGEITSKEITYEYMTTADTSEGMRRLHTGWYPVHHCDKTYNLNGRLAEKFVFGTSWGSFARDRKVIYNPPGKWIGKRDRNY